MESTFKIILFLSGIMGISLLSCNKETSVGSNNYFGEPFFLKISESATIRSVNSDNNIPDSTLTVEFIKIVYDSRCPKASCYLCYGSSAIIQGLLSDRNNKAAINLTIPGCSDEYSCDEQLYYRKDTLGYRFCLLRLDPYPESGTTVNQVYYKAKLNISKL